MDEKENKRQQQRRDGSGLVLYKDETILDSPPSNLPLPL